MSLEDFQARLQELTIEPGMDDFSNECRGYLSLPLIGAARCLDSSVDSLIGTLESWLKDGESGSWTIREDLRLNHADEPTRDRFAAQLTAIVLTCVNGNSARLPVSSWQAVVHCLKSAFPKLAGSITIVDQAKLPEVFRQTLRNLEVCPWSMMAADLLQSLRPANDAVLTPVGQAETPVLFRHGNDASVFILTVQLFADGTEGIVPELRSLGSIALEDNLCTSTLEIWRKSGLSGKRAVWSLRPYSLGADKVGDSIRLSKLGGHSMEAALLAALWAANGGIPGDEEFQSIVPLEMEKRIAVTASVTAERGEPAGTFNVDSVEFTDLKLRAARAAELDSVLLCPPERDTDPDVSKVTGELKKEADQKQQALVSGSEVQRSEAMLYPGLNVIRVNTARAVFDLLLVRNRWLAKWQDVTRDNWLVRWEDGTARAPNDNAPGLDNKNPRTTGSEAGADGEEPVSGNEAE